MSIAVITFALIFAGLALVLFAGYLLGQSRKKEDTGDKIKRLIKEIEGLDATHEAVLGPLEEDWVLDRNQQRVLRRRPKVSRPSDLSDPQMGEGRHG